MATLDYFLNLPATNDNPSVDQPNMATNTNSVNTLIAVDHNTFGVSPYGYHTVIHLVPNIGGTPTNPPLVAGFGQLFSKNVTVGSTTDTQLFFETGLGGISQLTGGNASANGYQWIGSVLIQWGSITGTPIAPNQAVTFPLAFPSAVFSITLGPASNSSNDKTMSIKTGTVSTTGFQVQTSNSSSFQTIYWMAIGN